MSNKLSALIEAYVAGFDLLSLLKPLVWEDGNPPDWVPVRDRVESTTPFGKYRVEFNLRELKHYFTTPNVEKQVPFNAPKPCDSIDHGKSLCFEDYHARVKSLRTVKIRQR